MRRGDQQVPELAQSAWPDDITLIRSKQVTLDAFSDEHVEVVHPEIGNYLLQLPFAVSLAAAFPGAIR